MTRLVGDLHTRKEKPFRNAVKKVFTELDNDEEVGTIIQLGDFFHSSKPFPGDYDLAIYELRKLAKKNKIYIMAGNNAHEYHYIQKTYAIDPLLLDNVTLIKEPQVITVEGKVFLLLPWVPTEVANKFKADSIEDLYSDIGKYIELPTKIDYVLYHFEDETVFMGGENHGIDLSYLEKTYPEIRRVGGHIHLQSPNYLGSPYQTRYDEKGQQSHYLLINEGKETYKDFNHYFEYYDLDYQDELPETDLELMLTVKNAPSVEAAYEKFKGKGIYFRDVQISFGQQRESTEAIEETSNSIKEFLVEYLDINKVDAKTSKYLLKII